MKKLKEFYKRSSKMTILAVAIIPYYIAWSIYHFYTGDVSMGLAQFNTAILWFIIVLAWRTIDRMTETSKISNKLLDQLFEELNKK